ncbi:MAG: hypothetical protein LBI28_12145 [Treponema sp.]|jgi:hypothetical protein|nr:hypothetical protein [Treponema sp.]
MKRRLFLLIFFSLTAVCGFSAPLESLISPDLAARLNSGDPIIETQLRNPAPRLLPQNRELQQLVTGAMRTIAPTLLAETIYLYRKPAHLRTNSNIWDEAQKTRVFNQILAISTLTGVQYYSASRGEMRTFYEYSRVIDGPNTKNPIADPVFAHTDVNLTLSIHARQRDLTFGDNIYAYNYSITRDALFFTQENVTALSYGIVRVIGRGNLRSVMAVIDCGDSILIYSASMAKAVSLPGASERVSNSISNRASAVLNWFINRLNREFNVQ